MALTVDFTASQIPGSPQNIVLTDTTTGTDVAVTQRRVYIQDSAGNYIVEEGTATEYEAWPNYPSTLSLTLTDILDEDTATRVVVQWLNSSNVVLYDKTVYVGFARYNKDFDYSLVKAIAGNPLLMNDNQYFSNKLKLYNYIVSGDNAVVTFSDLEAAQICYDEATDMRNNKATLFNINA